MSFSSTRSERGHKSYFASVSFFFLFFSFFAYLFLPPFVDEATLQLHGMVVAFVPCLNCCHIGWDLLMSRDRFSYPIVGTPSLDKESGNVVGVNFAVPSHYCSV